MLDRFEPLTAQVIVSMLNVHPVSYSYVNSGNNYLVIIIQNAQLCFSGQYIMSLWSIDDSAGVEELENLNCTTAVVASSDVAITLTLKCKLDVRRLCKCHLFYQILQRNEILNVSLANNFELSKSTDLLLILAQGILNVFLINLSLSMYII